MGLLMYRELHNSQLRNYLTEDQCLISASWRLQVYSLFWIYSVTGLERITVVKCYQVFLTECLRYVWFAATKQLVIISMQWHVKVAKDSFGKISN